MTHLIRKPLATLLCIGLAGNASMASAQTRSTDLAAITLEDLLNIEITSASRKEQRVGDTPAAVYVITQDAIRRSGITTIPELFRLVPGTQVAQVNSNNWAISVRGFNDLWANKLLVLVDGRSIYTRTLAGVSWSMQGLLLEDIDRIEVIRGPGGSIWGADAVNGVVNIITKTAADTQGTLVRVGAGTYDRGQGALRYGGSFWNVDYRVFAQWADHDGSLVARRTRAADAWHRFTNGFRLDWSGRRDSITTAGSFVNGSSRPLWSSFTGPAPSLSTAVFGATTQHDGSVLGRWTRSTERGGKVQVQSFFDVRQRIDGNGVRLHENTWDLDAQFRTEVGSRHDVILGGGYRDSDAITAGTFAYSVSPASSENDVLNVFAQDDIALTDRARLTIGSKFERDSFAGWNVQPTVRFITPIGRHDQRVWAAVARAVRTPSTNDLGIRVNYAAFTGDRGIPIVLGLIGNPDYQTEQFLDAEGGYRIDLGTKASADITVFRGNYKSLTTNEPMAPVFETMPGPPHLFIATQFANLLDVDNAGIEVAGHWAPAAAWRIDASYSGLRLTPHADAASHDPAAPLYDGNVATQQWQVHTSTSLGRRLEVDGRLFHVGRLRKLEVPAYTRVDVRLEFQISRPLSVAATGQNLFNPAHAEFANAPGVTSTLIPRSVNLRLLWRF